MASDSLCPGYKHVAAFGPDEEYEDAEGEVEYVTLDLGSVEPTLVPSSSTYRLIGLDTPTPFLQLSGTILKGRHESLLGTELIFTDGKDPHDPSKKAITHVANTERRICFREVRLQPKGAAVSSTATFAVKGKGKEREREERETDGWAAEAETATYLVDRVSGKSAPRARVARRRSERAAAKRKGKGRAAVRDDDEDYEEEGEEDGMDVEGA